MRFSLPRRDLRVTVDDVPVRPALALGPWAAFSRAGGGHTKVNETPRLFFMHFWANDDALELAGGLLVALNETSSRPAGR